MRMKHQINLIKDKMGRLIKSIGVCGRVEFLLTYILVFALIALLWLYETRYTRLWDANTDSYLITIFGHNIRLDAYALYIVNHIGMYDLFLGNLTVDDVFQRILSHWEKTKEKATYRPFKSCDELVYYWEREKVGYSVNPLQMIDIWVKHKVDGRRRMIVGFGANFVEVGVKAKPITLERLYETYTFLDGGPCGVKETGII